MKESQPVLIMGSIGIDNIETPFGKVDNVLGGSATYAAFACSFFAPVNLFSIIGEDFPKDFRKQYEDRNISFEHVTVKGKNFRWTGKYEFDMNEAKTIDVQLNSLIEMPSNLSIELKKSKFIFLANTDSKLQLDVLKQLKESLQLEEKERFVVLDTMNYWIENSKESLLEALNYVDLLVLNDGEARQLFNTVNLIKAGKEALKIVSHVIIKKGEHGSLYFSKEGIFNAPGYPLEVLKDPTGCGDCFGGGIIGYLAKTDDVSELNIRKAIIYGSAIASFNAEDFSTKRLEKMNLEDIENRYKEFEKIREF